MEVLQQQANLYHKTSSEVKESTSTTTENETHMHKASLLKRLKSSNSDLTQKSAVDLNLLSKMKGNIVFHYL